MDESKDQIKRLAKLVVMQNETNAQLLGQMKAVTAALAALVRTHPAPEEFAQALRRAWMQGDVSLEDDSTSQHAAAGIEQVLEVLEGNCSVPLNIRPPGTALPPEH